MPVSVPLVDVDVAPTSKLAREAYLGVYGIFKH
jgi:hypothetical protein